MRAGTHSCSTGSELMGRWMSDPLVSRAADRSGFDVNGDLFALLESLQGVLEEVERALPGVNVPELRVALNSGESVDVREMFLELTRRGRTPEAAFELCVAIDPQFTAPSLLVSDRRAADAVRRAAVIAMLKDGRKLAEISEECHLGFTRISQIRREEGLTTSVRVATSPDRLRSIAVKANEIGIKPTSRFFGCAIATVRLALAEQKRMEVVAA
jgi:hypothetical protein